MFALIPLASGADVAEPLARVRVEHVFVIDTGGPMLASANAAREPIARYVERVPAGDRVAILAFHTRAGDALPSTEVPTDPAGLAQQIRTLELPSAPVADLGAAMYSLSKVLAGDDVDARLVYVLSFYCHDPSVASPWDVGGRGCRTIRDEVALQAEVNKARVPFAAWLLPMPPPDGRAPIEEGKLAVGRVLAAGGPEAPPALDSWLATQSEQLDVARSLPALRYEARTGSFSVQVMPGDEDPARARLRLTTTTRTLGLRLDRIELTGATSAATVPILLSPSAELDATLALPPAPFSLVPRTGQVPVTVTVTADATLVPGGPLAEANLDGARRGLTSTVTTSVAQRWGPSVPVFTVGVLVALIAVCGLAVLTRERVAPLTLTGTFVWRGAGQARRILEVGSRREVGFSVGADGEVVVVPAPQGDIVIRAGRTLTATRVDAEVRRSDVEINGRRVAPGRHSIVAGATSFKIAGNRLTWE